jgi:drug/metabolite transporter (DMT)-like permease
MMHTKPRTAVPPLWIADLMLLIVAIVWGTSYGVAKQALVYYPVLGFLAVRFCLTLIILAPTLRTLRTPEGRVALKAGLPLGCILLAIFLCETYGVAHTRAANAAFLISLCVVFTPFAEWAVLRQRPETSAFVLTFVSLLGAYLLTSGLHGDITMGDGLMLLAAVLRALMVCFTKRLTRGKAIPALTLTAIQSGVVGIGSLVLAIVIGGEQVQNLPSQSTFWFSTVYMVLFCTIFAFFAQNYAVSRSSPTRVSLLMGSEPVFGALFASLWLGEHLGLMAWGGGALIVVASLWATLPKPKPKSQPVPEKVYA